MANDGIGVADAVPAVPAAVVGTPDVAAGAAGAGCAGTTGDGLVRADALPVGDSQGFDWACAKVAKYTKQEPTKAELTATAALISTSVERRAALAQFSTSEWTLLQSQWLPPRLDP